jgi:hypothetical protein
MVHGLPSTLLASGRKRDVARQAFREGWGGRMKHIFIGIDGTANAAFYDTMYGNVYRMNLSLDSKSKSDNSPQIFIYFSGVGATSQRWLGLLGKAFGQGIDEIILQAYVNLVANYEEGDKIYVFGFSRGAVAARALTGMISHSGLVRYDHSPEIQKAWHYFVGNKDKAGDYETKKAGAVHPNVRIEFLGVWDSVYGISSELALRESLFKELRFRNFNLDESVKHGVQILAIDDTRRLFHPMIWDAAGSASQKMEQIWMPGVHSDIGGGYEKSFLSAVSMFAMIDKLVEYCPDVGLELKHIANFVRPMLDQDVAVNNEWDLEDFTKHFKLGAGRPCNNGDAARKQSVHPLLAVATGRDIWVKTGKARYAPSYVLANADLALPTAAFLPDSYTATIVANAIKAKFP